LKRVAVRCDSSDARMRSREFRMRCVDFQRRNRVSARIQFSNIGARCVCPWREKWEAEAKKIRP